MLAHVWNSISPGMFSTYHFSCLFHWYILKNRRTHLPSPVSQAPGQEGYC